MAKKALLVGATGLVGAELLNILLEDKHYEEVRVLSRRPLSESAAKLQVKTIDFEHLSQVESVFFEVDEVFCCLGITLRKAGSKANAYRVEHDYPLELAQKSRQAGAKQFIIVSSLGANAESSNYYFRTKGVLEKALQTLGFPSLHILRPSLLLGPRREVRLAEDFAKVMNHAFSFFIPLRYRGIQARTVAKFMQLIAKKERQGSFIYESDLIRRIEVRSFDINNFAEQTKYRDL